MAAETPRQTAILATLATQLDRPVCDCDRRHGLRGMPCGRPATTYSRWHSTHCVDGYDDVWLMCVTCQREIELQVAATVRGFMARAGRPMRCHGGCGLAFRSLADVLLEVGDLP